MRKKVCMVAGEASADKHAAGVIRELKGMVPDVEVFGMGGSEMRAAGMECLYGTGELSVMGFSDVAPRVRHIFSVFKGLIKAIEERRPDVVMPVDLPDFNMRLSRKAKRLGVKVLYYIAPQAWAWRSYRARTLAKITDGLAVIFPFEQGFFSAYGVNARYVGNPCMEGLGTDAGEGSSWPPRNVLLMPGSRLQEIETILPVMCEAKRLVQERHRDLAWHMRIAPGLDGRLLEERIDADILLTREMPPVDLAMVKSGTSSFEMAVSGIPEVICYKTSPLNYRLAKAFVTLDHIGMPNIILGRTAVPELIQEDFTPENLALELRRLIEDEDRFRKMQSDFALLREKLGNESASTGVASWLRDIIT
jgi:lipid-A-disaccharide synthase